MKGIQFKLWLIFGLTLSLNRFAAAQTAETAAFLFIGHFEPVNKPAYKSSHALLSAGFEGLVTKSKTWELGAVFVYGSANANYSMPDELQPGEVVAAELEQYTFAFMTYWTIRNTPRLRLRAGTGLGAEFESEQFYANIPGGIGLQTNRSEDLILPVTVSAEIGLTEKLRLALRSSVHLYTGLTPSGVMNAAGVMYRF